MSAVWRSFQLAVMRLVMGRPAYIKVGLCPDGVMIAWPYGSGVGPVAVMTPRNARLLADGLNRAAAVWPRMMESIPPGSPGGGP